MKTSDFDFDLPASSIAQHPCVNRDESRLLVMGRYSGKILHRRFSDILDYLGPGDVLVRNDSKVFPARVLAKKETGALVEFLLLEETSPGFWSSMVKPGRKARVGDVFKAGPLTLEIVGLLPEGFRQIKIDADTPFMDALEEIGEVPLPPYIHEPLLDKQRYQTVFASSPGSVAAPTAGLHFTKELLRKIETTGCKIATLTLHVGPGTFRPVSAENIDEHVMHSERFFIGKKCAETIRQAKRVICVGTTSLRTLEALAASEGGIRAFEGKTDIFIYPGYKFHSTNALITNFHLPKSTLLMLVSAFSTHEFIREAYREALREGYRFFSFGDAMFITDQV